MSRADYDDPLYRETIPRRISAPSGHDFGPTEQYRRLLLERELWATLADLPDGVGSPVDNDTSGGMRSHTSATDTQEVA